MASKSSPVRPPQPPQPPQPHDPNVIPAVTAASATPAVEVARYRLKAGAKLHTKAKDPEGRPVFYGEGDIVELTPNQARAFADRVERI